MGQTTVDGLKGALEMGSQVTALAAAFAYLLGLLVVNLFLSRYGANYLGFVTPQYFAVGAWAIYPMVAGFALLRPISGARGVPADSPGRHRFERALARLAGVTVGAAVFGGPLFLMGVDFRSHSAAGWVVCLLLAMWTSSPKGLRRWNPTPVRAEGWAFGAVLMLAVVIFYCISFSYAYATIPARWGGGGDNDVRILLSQEGSAELRPLFGQGDSTGIPMRLLLMSDDGALVAPRSTDRAYFIRRSSIAAIALEGNPIGPGHRQSPQRPDTVRGKP